MTEVLALSVYLIGPEAGLSTARYLRDPARLVSMRLGQ